MIDETQPGLPPLSNDDDQPPQPPSHDLMDDNVASQDYDDLDGEYDDEDEAYLDDDDTLDDDDLAPLPAEAIGTAETAPLDFDIDAALAAIGSLGSVMSEQAAVEAAEHERLDAERRTEEEYQRWAGSYQFPRPGMTRIQTGRPSSLIPAVGLMGLGALATFGSTLNLPITPALLGALALIIVGLALVSYWLSSKRWARGALFVGLSAVGGAALIALPLLTALTLPAVAPWMMVGAALVLTGLFSRPTSGGLSALGAGVVIASVAALVLL